MVYSNFSGGRNTEVNVNVSKYLDEYSESSMTYYTLGLSGGKNTGVRRKKKDCFT
jgi:hypothetical protein